MTLDNGLKPPTLEQQNAQADKANKANLAPLVDQLEPGLVAHPASQGPWYSYGGLGFDVAVQLSQAISLKRIADSLVVLVQQRDADALASRLPRNVDLDTEPLRAKAPWYKGRPQSTHPDGWFMHNPGDPPPVIDSETLVDLEVERRRWVLRRKGGRVGKGWGRQVYSEPAYRYKPETQIIAKSYVLPQNGRRLLGLFSIFFRSAFTEAVRWRYHRP